MLTAPSGRLLLSCPDWSFGHWALIRGNFIFFRTQYKVCMKGFSQISFVFCNQMFKELPWQSLKSTRSISKVQRFFFPPDVSFLPVWLQPRSLITCEWGEPTLLKQSRTMCCCADWVTAMLLQCKVDKDETMTSQIAPDISIEGGVSSSCFFSCMFLIYCCCLRLLPLFTVDEYFLSRKKWKARGFGS